MLWKPVLEVKAKRGVPNGDQEKFVDADTAAEYSDHRAPAEAGSDGSSAYLCPTATRDFGAREIQAVGIETKLTEAGHDRNPQINRASDVALFIVGSVGGLVWGQLSPAVKHYQTGGESRKYAIAEAVRSEIVTHTRV